MATKLATPVFIKVKDIEQGNHGYNVYVRIVSAAKEEASVTTQSGKKLTIVKAVVADETAQANAFFKLEDASFLTEGKVVAIRNGRRQIVKGHITLETDIFGRITPEDVDVKPTTTYDISAKEAPQRRREPRERR